MEADERTAAAAAEYYRWLAGQGGREPAELLEGLEPSAREQVLGAIDDVNFLWSLTTGIRAVNPRVAKAPTTAVRRAGIEAP